MAPAPPPSSPDTGSLVLELVDPATDCIVAERRLGPAEADALRKLLALQPEQLRPWEVLDLDLPDDRLDALREALGLTADYPHATARLRPRHLADALPYTIHTNRELILMRQGLKPLACFYEEYPRPGDASLIPEQYFEPFVTSGAFVRREYVALCQPKETARSIRYVFYARRGEAWRIDAFILLQNTGAVTGWNEALERMEGTLLGYEEWQTEAFINIIFNRDKKQ